MNECYFELQLESSKCVEKSKQVIIAEGIVFERYRSTLSFLDPNYETGHWTMQFELNRTIALILLNEFQMNEPVR